MGMSMFRYRSLFCKLVATHLFIARQHIFDQIINLYIWTCCTLVIMGYIMQSFGLAHNYGCFQFASIVGVVGLFEVYNLAARNIMDIDGDRTISYYLTLPGNSSVTLLSMACSYALVGMMLTLCVLPLGKIIFYNQLNFTQISWFKFIVMASLANIFFGIFVIAITAHVGTISRMRNIWSRFIWPLWFLGCYQFSWAAISVQAPVIGYMFFCNPVMFVMEGMRGALLGLPDALPWELCCVALCFFIVVCWNYAHYKMQRLLDFV